MDIPLDLIIKITSYLPIMTIKRRSLNKEIIMQYYKKKWLNIYKSFNEYDKEKSGDNYYVDRLENDIISALNNEIPLISGLTKELSNILKRIHSRDIYTYEEYDLIPMEDSEKAINTYLRVLQLSELYELDRRLEEYNKRISNGELAFPLIS